MFCEKEDLVVRDVHDFFIEQHTRFPSVPLEIGIRRLNTVTSKTILEDLVRDLELIHTLLRHTLKNATDHLNCQDRIEQLIDQLLKKNHAA